MLIGSKFKRPKAPIDLGDKIYFFLPRDPANPDSEHVAEVSDNTHIQKLLAITEGYYIAEQQAPAPVAPKPTPAPTADGDAATNTATGEGEPPAPAASLVAGSASEEALAGDTAATETPSAPTGSVEAPTVPDDVREAADNLLGLSWQAVGAQVRKGGIPHAVLGEALRIEQGKAEDDRRSAVIKALQQALEAG